MRITLRCYSTHQPEHHEVMVEHGTDFSGFEVIELVKTTPPGIGFLLRDVLRSDIKGCLIFDHEFYARFERSIIEAHHARVAALTRVIRPGASFDYVAPPAPGSADMAIDELHITRSHAGLKREHESLQQKFSDLTSRYEALLRDTHPEYSTERCPFGTTLPIEPTVVIVRVPRSGDMHDVADASDSLR